MIAGTNYNTNKVLNLNYKHLTSLPVEIGNLINLKELYLFGNNLTINIWKNGINQKQYGQV